MFDHIGIFSSVATTTFALSAFSCFVAAPLSAQSWTQYAHDPQHTTISAVPSQIPQQVRWSTPVDLAPQYTGSDLYIHYGTPLITPANTVIVPVKTGATDGFEVEAIAAYQGTVLWTLSTDYSVPPHDWFPICGITLTPDGSTLAIPAAGGTILTYANPDNANGTPTRIAFFGIDNYNANPSAWNAAIQICTPISSDAQGNLYFGFISSGAALPGYPNGISSGLARISNTGAGSFVSAAAISGDATMVKVTYNCAVAFSNDGSTLYVAVNNAQRSKTHV